MAWPSGHGNLKGSEVAAAKVTEGLFPVRAGERVRRGGGDQGREGGRRLSGEWSLGALQGWGEGGRRPGVRPRLVAPAGQVLRRGKVCPCWRGFWAGLHLAGLREEGFVSPYHVQPLAPRLRVPQVQGNARPLKRDN